MSEGPGAGQLEKRIAWAGNFNGYLPFEPGVLDVCRGALETFESMGCVIEEAQPSDVRHLNWGDSPLPASLRGEVG